MPPIAGRVVAGRYLLQQPIGRGAMGIVWRARDQLLDREVAVKEVMISNLIGEDERRNAYQRTLREARTAGRLSHRSVVAVYDVAEEDGRPWVIMELVPSRSLDQVLTADGRLSPLRAGRIGQQVLAALAHAHACGVLHRDVKPSNVLIASERGGGPHGWDERAVLTDFGIAQFEGDPRLTQTGMVMGSPGFTAPERIRGGDATPASDLWSLGATIYTAVEGRGPYEQRGGPITTMSAIIHEDAPVAPHAGQLGPLIAALLRRDPAQRPSVPAAARMFAQVLPRLKGVTAPSAPSHPATVRSAHVPPQADEGVSAETPAVPRAAAADEGSPRRTGTVTDAPPSVADGDDAEAAGPAETTEHADATDAAAQAVQAEAEVIAEAEGIAEAGAAAAAEEVAAGGGGTAGDAGAGETGQDAAEAAGTSAEAGETEAGDRADEHADRTTAGAGAAPVTAQAAATSVDPVVEDVPAPRTAAPLRPTFTASRPGERIAPTFSAAPRQPAGGTKPLASSGVQYAGPSLPPPDTTAQYPPGTAGGQGQHEGERYRGGQRQGGPRRRGLVIVAVLVLVAAVAAGVVLAVALPRRGTGQAAARGTSFGSVNALNDATTTPPGRNWTPFTVTAAEAGSHAGFTIDLPPGWRETRAGSATHFTGPGDLFLDIDLTRHPHTNMVTEGKHIARQALSAGSYPGYRLRYLQEVPVRGTRGAIWQFTWAESDRKLVDDILFIKPTSAGAQSYAVYIQGAKKGWASTSLPVFEKILRTFQTVPAS